MGRSEKDGDGSVWFAVIVGLVFLCTVLATALILGPVRSDEGRSAIRIERPNFTIDHLPNPQQLPRQVV